MVPAQLKKSKSVKLNSKKRKASSSKSSQALGSKSRKISVSSQRLPWKRTAGAVYDFEGFEDGEGGMLELEEIDDVDVVWEEGLDGAKKISFKVREDQLPAEDEQKDEDSDIPFDPEEAADIDEDEEEWTGFSTVPEHEVVQDVQESPAEPVQPVASTSRVKETASLQSQDVYETPFDDTTLPGFQHIHLLPSLKRAIHSMEFTKPSAIQEATLSTVLSGEPYGVKDCDIVGVAETGSGKTLAYSLPVLQDILTGVEATSGEKRSLSALILCPTRELALQVRQHVGDVVYKASIPAGVVELEGKKTKYAPRVNIITICGGMSVHKQKRLLSSNYGVDIIVATPGRLWDMIQEDEEIGKQIKGVRFLILDEADRMIENGHFAELESIVGLTRRTAKGKGKASAKNAEVEAVFKDEFENPTNSLEACPVREEINTYVFSATMSKELQRNVKRKVKSSSKFALSEDEKGHMGALGDLLAKLDFRDEDPLVVDLTPEGGVVKSLQEVSVDCLLTEKDAYLYYFLLRYPGRTLVFLSSIDAIRRLQPLLQMLELNVVVLHSGMQQRARLKALDRFKSAASMVLLATDVAARGLDVLAVEHVVHYQLPRTADTYIHRSGRTARAGNEGLSLQLCAPEEKPTQKALMKSLGKTGKLKELHVEFSLLNTVQARVELARQIEVAAHRASKAAHEENWLQQAAKDMDIDMDDQDDDSDGGRGLTKRKSKATKGQERELRAQLKTLLAQPLMLRGISAKYLSAGGSSKFAEDMLKGSSHQTMLGLTKSRAVEDAK